MIWLKRVGFILVIICLGTIIDYIVHQMDPRFSVPDTYFSHKIFYGTLWAFMGYLVFRRRIHTYLQLAVTMAAVPAILLQTMYFIQGHQLQWVVFLFLALHFLMFLLPGFYICRRFKNIFIDIPRGSSGR